MPLDHLSDNLRLLCSYGRSASDVCRRAGINRQQFSKYLNGHALPSLSTLRRLCDFFGVDEQEILLDTAEFRELVRVRAPRFAEARNTARDTIERLMQTPRMNQAVLESHAGYYHTYCYPDPKRDYYYRSLSRIYQQDGIWMVKSIDRNLDAQFMLPNTLKYNGLVLEGNNRIVICEREQILGQGVFQCILYASDHAPPTFLSGLMMSIAVEGVHEISCVRTVWQYLGQKPNLKDALGKCGTIDLGKEVLPDIIINCTDNRMVDGEDVLSPRV